MKSNKKIYFIAFLISWIIFAACMVSDFSEFTTDKYKGIAVDSQDLLYVGYDKVIKVYDKGKLVKEIPSYDSNSGTYNFIIENDMLIIYKYQKVFYHDLNGNFLKEEDDSGSEKARAAEKLSKKCTVKDGTYALVSVFGRENVYKFNTNNEKEAVYKMPIFDYTVKILKLISSEIGFAFFILYYKDNIIKAFKRMENW